MNGFANLGAIHCVYDATTPHLTERMRLRFERLGITSQVTCVPATLTPGDPRIGVLLTHRSAVATAQARGFDSVLVLSGDVYFHHRAPEILAASAAELASLEWTLCYLGGWWPEVLERAPGCKHLDYARKVANPHAVAYHRRVYERVLSDVPDTLADLADWVTQRGDIETYLMAIKDAVVVHPPVTTVPALLPFEPVATQPHFGV